MSPIQARAAGQKPGAVEFDKLPVRTEQHRMMALLTKLFRWLGLAVLGTAVVTALLVAGIAIFSPRIDLGGLRPRFEALAGEALGRSVQFEGPLALVLSLPPAIEISQLRIGNPPDWVDQPFASLGSARAVVQLTPLLLREIHVDEVRLADIGIDFQVDQQGRENWRLPTGNGQGQGPGWKLVQVADIVATGARLHYHSERGSDAWEAKIERLQARLPARDPMQLTANGAAGSVPFAAQVRTGSLAGLTAQASWPVTAALQIDGHALEMTGGITDPLAAWGLDLAVQLEGTQLAELAAVFGIPVPAIGEYRVAGRIRGDAKRLELSGIDVRLGGSTLAGDLMVSGLPDQLRVSGAMLAPTVDAGPWLDAEDLFAQDEPQTPVDGAGRTLPQVELQLEVGEVVNLPFDLRNVDLRLKLHDNSLVAPLSLILAEVNVSGDLAMTAEQGGYRASGRLESRDVDVGGLVSRFTDLEGIEGSMASFALSGSSKGGDVRTLLKNLALRLRVEDVAMSYGNLPGETPVDVSVGVAEFEAAPGRRTQFVGEGSLLGEPFTTALQLGELSTLLTAKKLPLDLRASGAGAELTMSGQLAGVRSGEDTTLTVKVSGEQFGKLAPWLGVADDVELPVAAAGELWLQNDRNAWQLRDLDLKLGGSAITGALGVSQRLSKPLYNASLAFDVIDPLELKRAVSPPAADRQGASRDGPDLDMPILPGRLELNDMDIDVVGKRLVLQPSDITDIAFSTRIRDGHVADAPFSGTLAETAFRGRLSMDLREEVPVLGLNVEAGDVNVGQFLRDLQLATEVDAHTDRLTAKLSARGGTVNEILGNTKIEVEAERGRWLLFASEGRGGIEVTVRRGVGRSDTSQRRSVFELDATIGEVPMDFVMETQRVTAASGTRELLASKIRASAAGAELVMDGVTPRLSGFRELDIDMSLRGESMDSLSDLLDVSLPPFGPYTVAGRLSVGKTGFGVSDIDVRVGGSNLQGKVEVVTSGSRPAVDLNLTATAVQLDDFRLGDWTPVERPGGKDATVPELVAEPAPGTGLGNGADDERDLLSREVMRGFDLSGRIAVEQVLSGQDSLGSGTLSLDLNNGRLEAPLVLDLPGGGADLLMILEAGARQYLGRLQTKVDNFDYGIFARRIKPETDAQGRFSLDIDLESAGEVFGLLDDNASGHFDFVIWPEKLRAGIFDTWTANLFFALLPVLNPESESKVNCIVGRFDMQDGIMRPKSLFMDATRSQAQGGGKIDFTTETLQLRLTPISKRPKLFSVATPVVVEGSFSDFGVNLRPGDLLGTAIRFVYTGIVVPLQYMIRGVRPAMDVAECEKAMGIAGREPAEAELEPSVEEEDEFEDE
jgi:uncharacterized protein involved in outer membrane biogenesis